MATRNLSENIQTAITDLSNIQTALVAKGVAIPAGTPTNAYSGMIDGLQIGAPASAEFNIHFGDVAPEDITKLWVKTAPVSNIKLDCQISSVLNATTRVNDVINVATSEIVSGYGGCAERVDNLVYLLGGYTMSPKILTYNLNTLVTESTGVAMPSNYFRYAATGRVGDFIYLLGGLKYETMSLDVYKYSISENTLTKLVVTIPNNGVYGWQSCGYATVGSKIYLFGGYKSTSSSYSYISTSAYYFDTETLTFTTIAAPLSSRAEMGTAVIGTDIYMICGRNSSGSIKDTIIKYDTLLDNYVTVATLPVSCVNCRATNIGTDIYVFYDKSIYKYDTITNLVTTVSSGLTWGLNGGTIISYGTDIFYFCGSGLANGAFKNITDVTLETDHLLLSSLKSGRPIELFNQHGIDLKLPVSGVFKGDANNKAQRVNAYYYNNAQWNVI
ncbi:Kelch repeat-containing protein [Acetobacterium carbinolicum]|uniref:Kelch repeat-containing protein n=1 Tax=Acetobacterium carbinolicum TaxID=52690 RepID=UPI0039C95211